MHTYSDRKNNAEQFYEYDVALSFAGEHRDYVKKVAENLKSMGIKVFYDEDKIVDNWGQSGIEVFSNVYSHQSRYVVMFTSKEYVEKFWTKIELSAALNRMFKANEVCILPVRLDNTPVPSLPADILFLRANEYTPAQLSAAIASKLGDSRSEKNDSDSTLPRNSSLSGEVTFDYSNFDGRFVLGKRSLEFETKWTKSSDTNIHAYRNPPSIDGIALAQNINEISEIKQAASLDYSSRVRTVQVGELLVLRSMNNFYAAIRVLGIKDRNRGADRDELKFQYAIQSNRSDDFSNNDVQKWVEVKSDQKSELDVGNTIDCLLCDEEVKFAYADHGNVFDVRCEECGNYQFTKSAKSYFYNSSKQRKDETRNCLRHELNEGKRTPKLTVNLDVNLNKQICFEYANE